MKNNSVKSRLSFKRRDDTLWGWVFVLPFLIGFILVFVKVFATGIGFAFSDVSMENGLSMSFAGFKNFNYALRVDAEYIKLLVSDIETLVGTIPIILIFSLFCCSSSEFGYLGQNTVQGSIFPAGYCMHRSYQQYGCRKFGIELYEQCCNIVVGRFCDYRDG